MKVQGIDHIHIMVTDLAKAVAVAETLVGGPSSEPYGGEDWNTWASYHQLGGFDLFAPIDTDKPILGVTKVDIGAYILAFRVDDIDEAVEEAVEMGLRVVSRVGSEEAGFGKLMLQAQFENYFGPQLELVERGLPDDPLHCPIPEQLDHIELYVNDLDAAAEFFGEVTGHAYGDQRLDDRHSTVSETNALGVRLTAATSPASPIAHSLARRGEGIRGLGIVSTNLTAGIAAAQGLGLRLTERYDTDDAAIAEFDPADFFGIAIKLVQSH